MVRNKKLDLSPEELTEINDALLKGMVSRASLLCFFFAPTFALYSLTSYDFIKHFKSDLTLFDNTWPRLLFNALPMLIMGFALRNHSTNTLRKAWLWTFGLPVVFFIACMIYVWPLMYEGHAELYLYVHSANMFVMTTALMVAAPSPRFLIAQTSLFILIVFTPVVAILFLAGNEIILKASVGDIMIGLPFASYASYLVYKLRYKVARLDHKMKKAASPFLGQALANAIYNQREELLRNRRSYATVILMDIRGYTDFYKNSDPDIVREFMSAYHGMVSRYMGQFGGYWHKSIGDAQLATFGAMDAPDELADVTGIESELKAAHERKQQDRFNNALRAISSIAYYFEELKEKYDITQPLSLGIAISAGELEIRIQGDEAHKKELDIDGKVVIRCSRLETYTKVIRSAVAPTRSILVVSPELEPYANQDRMFQKWDINKDELRIPNFPEITSVQYHVFRYKDERRESVRQLRAS